MLSCQPLNPGGGALVQCSLRWMVLFALCVGLLAQSPLKQSDVPQSSGTPAGGPVQSEQRALAQLRTITETIKKCPASHTASAPMNVVWDIEQNQSVRSPKTGFVEFIRGKGDPPVLVTEECKPKDKACQQRYMDTLGIWNSMFETWEAAKPMQTRYEFDFGPEGLEFARRITRPEGADGTQWSAAGLESGCVTEAILAVVDDPMNSGTRPPEVPPELWGAAQRGEPNAIFKIGVLYSSGKGVPQNDAESVRWYRKGAEQGDVSSQLAFASSYLNGKGMAQEPVAAVYWYRKAAEQGSPRGQVMLGTLYGMGDVVPKNNEESYFWLYLAAPALGDDVKKVRDEIGGNLTQAKRLEVQERCRKWAEEHSQNHN